MAGIGSWIDPDTVDCEVENCYEINPYEDNCVYLYSECDFQGTENKVCDNSPFIDVDFEVKSIYLPDETTAYLYNMPCFNGESAEISQSISCLNTTEGEEDIDF